MKKRARWVWGSIGLSLLLAVAVIYAFRVTILMQAGRFMAPGGHYTADAAILEGNEFIDRAVVKSGMELLATGKVRRIAVVLHRIAPSHRPFAMDADYAGLVRRELEAAGLEDRDFRIIVTRIHHPVTLAAARGAMAALSKEENVKSAVLLSKGFHTRRSFLVYQHAGLPYGIKIYPAACFNAYPLDRWWLHEHGARDFVMELLKLAYYLAGRHIPFKFDY